MATLAEGQRAVVSGSRGTPYTLERKGDVYSCSCPAWRNQSVPIEARTCKHLRAYLGDAVETARVGGAATVSRAARSARVRAPLAVRYVEDREVRDAREAALSRALERFPVLDDRMQTVYGLRMPRHLAYAMGFWMGLTSAERREAWATMGNGPIGVGAWFLDGMLERTVKPGLDERLEYRFRCDPPEMVSIFSGNSDGGHWGLFYDDPKKLPSFVVMNYARDSAETSVSGRTLLEALEKHIALGGEGETFDPAEWPHRRAILDWLDVVLQRELDAYADDAPPWLGSRPIIIGGMGPIVPGWGVPDELVGYANQEKRSAAYRARDPVVGEWIALAKKEAAEGSPGRALFLGRELHWVDADEWRADCTELLVTAYEALDRRALAEIVKVHHAHRDLASVGVYEDPPQHALLAAAVAAQYGGGDLDALRAAAAAGPRTAADLAKALGAVTKLEILDVLLALPEAPEAADEAVVAHLEEAADRARWVNVPDEQDDARRAAIVRMLERAGARGEAFFKALAADPPIRAAAIAHADLGWRSARGRTVLHVAAGTPSAAAVRALLERGADARAVDGDGKTPYDAARQAWVKDATEAGAVFALLDAAGGGPPKPVVAPEIAWSNGMAVRHKQFGEGVVEAVEGEGEKTKLTVRFGIGTKVLVSKFVTPA